MMKRIAILGSTGSVGVNVLKVIKSLDGEFKVIGLTANTNTCLLKKQIKEFNPSMVAVNIQEDLSLTKMSPRRGRGVFKGIEGLIKVATAKEVDLVVICISGKASLLPLIEAIKSRKQIALASKEAIVMAGEIVNRLCEKNRVKIFPIDSEHNAIFQCLNGRDIKGVKRLILTGSGGPFNFMKKNELKSVSPRQALRHPRWDMGKKITIDSATLMNKGLEIIEARWLFGIPVERISVLIHPEAIIHSMVEFIDGNILALMGLADMRLPIQYALTYPKRQKNNLAVLDLVKLGKLTFYQPDLEKFPCLKLAKEAAAESKSFPCVLNAADEVCVEAFLKKRIKFNQIPEIIKRVLEVHKPVSPDNIKEVFLIDAWARAKAEKIINQIYS
ncbi:MAG: 1-deoxy-D-xylulose-5-phosphate reductoisomerase [Candidatus Omnitrophica bacterium]|nr:1-deoxy-D-xylulose-5-phosphate reductoisomerase [Candidatus Omnitrophota bacterium]